MNNRLLEVAAAVSFGLLLGVAGYAIWRNNDAPESRVVSTVSTLVPTGPIDPAPLVAAYERSRSASYALDGELERERDGASVTTPVRQTRDGNQALDEVGAVAIVTDGATLRRCELVAGQVLCTDPEPARSLAREVADFEQQISADASLYRVYEPALDDVRALLPATISTADIDCWRVIASRSGAQGLYGDDATVCFDRATGALVFRDMQIGSTTERFRVLRLRSEVTPADLEPTGG